MSIHLFKKYPALNGCFPMTNPSPENSSRKPGESLVSVLFTLDDQEIITYVSEDCTGILGLLPEEMIGRPLSAFIAPGGNVNPGEMCGQAKQGEKYPFRFSVVGRDGGIHQAIAISRSVFEGQGTVSVIGAIGVAGTGNPVEKITRMANTKIHFLNSIVRHDINNQLTVLNGYLSLMEPGDNSTHSPNIVKILLGATEKINKMVTFSSEYKDIGIRLPAWINLSVVFQSARSAFIAGSVRIIPNPVCQELELFCDPALTKVFHQLIDNSLRHGKTLSEISLLWKRENGGVIIVYEDNGAGIADHLRPTLFQPGNGKKIGYGLFLVREILAISGFTITETGTSGKGVRFEIFVPAGSFRVVKTDQQ